MQTRKYVINNKFGGFGLSREAVLRIRELSQNPSWGGVMIAGDRWDNGDICNGDYGTLSDDSIELRADPALVQTVEELGARAFGCHAKLKIVEVPTDVQVTLEEYDGKEWIAEVHRVWS